MTRATKLLGVLGAALTLSVTPPVWAAKTPSYVQLSGGEVDDEGAAIVAGPQGATYDLPNGTTLQLAPDTSIRFEPPIKLMLGSPKASKVLAVRLLEGRTDLVVPNYEAAVIVRAPFGMSSIIKRGHGSVLVTESAATAATFHGESLVGSGNTWHPLWDGTAKTFSKSGELEAKPLPKAPINLNASGLVVTRDDSTAKVSATWDPVPGAAHYELALAQKTTGKTLVQVSVPDSKAVLEDVKPGLYELKVRAYDSTGLDSPYSESAEARILGMKLPKESHVVEDGLILLGRYQSIELIGYEGLEITYGKFSHFAPAPQFVGLARQRPTTATLRDPKTDQRTSLRLEPLIIEAKVHFLTKNGVWPRHGLPIEVELETPTGRKVPPDFGVTAKLTVNVLPMPITWKRQASNVLRAVVPKPAVPGPWVIRVEVYDNQGVQVGRNLIELNRADKGRSIRSVPPATAYR